MMRIDSLTLQVPDMARWKAFYIEVLGMRQIKTDGDSEINSIGYSTDGLKLRFIKCDTARKVTARDAYWKIGIVVKNLDHAVEFLNSKSIRVSPASQFLDIGYLCHLQDPAGLGIELLQKGFEGRHETVGDNINVHPIGSQATLANIKIRVSDFEKTKTWCEEVMKMRLMSIQRVEHFGFTLYFYAWSDEELPNDSLEAVGNREWLRARSYAMLELQHFEGSSASSFLRSTPPGAAGPTKITCCNSNQVIEIDCHAELGL